MCYFRQVQQMMKLKKRLENPPEVVEVLDFLYVNVIEFVHNNLTFSFKVINKSFQKEKYLINSKKIGIFHISLNGCNFLNPNCRFLCT